MAFLPRVMCMTTYFVKRLRQQAQVQRQPSPQRSSSLNLKTAPILEVDP
jgi:hypothetical protein